MSHLMWDCEIDNPPGEVKPPNKSLTGPAPLRHLVCAPGAMTFSFNRRPNFFPEIDSCFVQ